MLLVSFSSRDQDLSRLYQIFCSWYVSCVTDMSHYRSCKRPILIRGSGWGLSICISFELSGDAEAIGPLRRV